jgi:cellulose synthase/poly-beta-1,6-N-acetylglucosamine synthase-like glycosyltransferase
MPAISFIIPVKPGGNIAALDALRHVDAVSPFEILIAEGNSPSRQRNAAVHESLGELVYFLDDDSLVTPECLAICTDVLQDSSVAAAGGPSLNPNNDSTFQKIIGSALSSIFGAGNVRNRYRAAGTTRVTTDRELILCNLMMRRDVFLSLGGFDERLYPSEENELLCRIQASGYKLVHIPHLVVQRSQRKTLRQFVSQMFSYGRGRAQQTLISGSISIISFAPLFFVMYLGCLLIVPLTPVMITPLIAYLVLDAVFCLSAVLASGNLSRALLLFLFPLMHAANGCGLLLGLFGGVRGTPNAAHGEITVKRIKTFEQVLW